MEKIKAFFSGKKFYENIGWKLLALVLATILWLVVISITDPIGKKTYYDVPVRLVNQSVITSDNKTLEVLDNSNILATVTLKAPRSILQEFGNSNDYILARADLNSISSDMTSVPIELSTTKYSDKIDSIRGSEENVFVSIENKETVQMPLQATTSGEVERGYIIGDVELAQNQIRISGPESVINRISKAIVDVQITGFTENISTEADVVLLDSTGQEISLHNLELNVKSVKVGVEILATRKVPVRFSTMGAPLEGFETTGEVLCTPESVLVAGSKSAMKMVDEIAIPATELNLTGQSGNLTALLKIENYLPAGVRLGDPAYNGNVSITVYVEPQIEQKYEINIHDIVMDYAPVEYNVEILSEDEFVTFVTRGLAQNIEKIRLSQLNCRIDFSDYANSHNIENYKEGEYKLNVMMDLPDGVILAQPLTIDVSLTPIAVNE